MADTVKVAPETFRTVEFRAATARKEYTEERIPDAQKKQRLNRDGVPEWSVKVLVEDWRGRDEIALTVTVPMHENPAEKLQRGQLVQLSGLTFGVTAKRNGGGYSTWYSADSITPAGVDPAVA